VLCRCQHSTLRLLRAGATVAGWVIFLPLDQRALFTAHEKIGLALTAFVLGSCHVVENGQTLNVEAVCRKR